MKLAIVTDDGKTISQHFGRAAYYEVVTVEDGSVIARERREKPAHQHHHHHEPNAQGGVVQLQEMSEAARPGPEAGDRHGAMIEPIRDCAVLISRGMGQGAHGSLAGAGIEPILTDVREIDEAVRQYLAGELANHPERLH